MSVLLEQDQATMPNLITDVPIEILKYYTKFLDLKSLVMFHCVCKKTSDKELIKTNEVQNIQDMLDSIIGLSKDILNILNSKVGQDKLLANILRRLIYISVSDITPHNIQTLASTQTLTEYNTILEHITDEFDISIHAFNDYLEDAQFEFRGFNIINISKERRDKLDMVKAFLRARYFTCPFTIHTYSTFGTTCVEIDSTKHVVMFDVHRHMEDELHDMMFLMDTVSNYKSKYTIDTGVKGTTVDDEIWDSMDKNIQLVNYMYHWDINNKSATKTMAALMMHVMDCQQIFKGTNDVCIEVWNDLMDSNWVLGQSVEELLSVGMYVYTLKEITTKFTSDYDYYEVL